MSASLESLSTLWRQALNIQPKHPQVSTLAKPSPAMVFVLLPISFAVAMLGSSLAFAGNSLDRKLSKDTSGIYEAQDAVPVSLGLLVAGCALWEGSESRMGKTCWQSGEAGLAGGLLAKTLQFATGREAPKQTDHSDNWFKSTSKGSFPSAHVTFTAALVTPVIAEYYDQHPSVALLALLPAYEMVARVKAQEHWQTDVLAGALLGVGLGVYEHQKSSPFILGFLPGGLFVGYGKQFK